VCLWEVPPASAMFAIWTTLSIIDVRGGQGRGAGCWFHETPSPVFSTVCGEKLAGMDGVEPATP